ncbi:MAG: hypothetical protein IT480_15540 [Gammaproteobacteria bacterium]|nr:hypothetical protein [Gammaproteobacteria bacterium]
MASLASCSLAQASERGREAESTAALPAGWRASNVQPIGYVALDRPRTFKLGLKAVGERWYLFAADGTGQSRGNGFTVIDVTDPGNMRPVISVDVAHANGQLTLNGNLLIVGQQPVPYAASEVGGSVEYPFRGLDAEVVSIATLFDISDPTRPEQLSEWRVRGWGTHRNVYPGGRLAFMFSWIAGYRGQSVLVLLDVSDPRKPGEVGRWWMPGQAESEHEIMPPSGYHGPANLSADGRLLTLGYTPAFINLDISDPVHPRLLGRLDFAPLAPVGTQAVHTVVPLQGGYYLLSTEPSNPGCDAESASFAAVVDNRDPGKPRLAGYFPRPVPAPGLGLKSFCDKEGRFGPHNVNTEMHQGATADPGEQVFMTYFNAGFRVFDVSDPRQPTEAGWFLPVIGPWREHQRGLEDVIVDTRGNVFVSNGREKGIWALRFRPLMDRPQQGSQPLSAPLRSRKSPKPSPTVRPAA